MKSSVLIVPIVIAAILAGVFFFFRGSAGLLVFLSPDAGPISAKRELTVKLQSSAWMELKGITVATVQEGKKVNVVVKSYPAGTHQAKESFNLSQAGLKEGPFTLQITTTKSIISHFGGSTTTLANSFSYENKPPVISVLSTAHNLTRGGAGLVIYTLSKEVEKTGVVFGNQFFPGFRQGGNLYACLFPFPYDMNPDQYLPRIMAIDRAGNERLVGINFHLLVKSFPSDRINLSDPFLEKIAAEFKDKFPQAKTSLEIFLKANSELRGQDGKILNSLGNQTSPVPLWEGNFVRLPNSAQLGAFAQTRSYVYHGEKVDQQTHLGIDLASLAHAPVPAGNRGKVIHADDLGLYGQCIVIDHGLGLQTLYGHLSRIGVKVGDIVEKGQIIGNTGATGMAGGDHLHNGVFISGQPVNPIEWWDPSWIKNNVTSKLEAAKTLVPK